MPCSPSEIIVQTEIQSEAWGHYGEYIIYIILLRNRKYMGFIGDKLGLVILYSLVLWLMCQALVWVNSDCPHSLGPCPRLIIVSLTCIAGCIASIREWVCSHRYMWLIEWSFAVRSCYSPACRHRWFPLVPTEKWGCLDHGQQGYAWSRLSMHLSELASHSIPLCFTQYISATLNFLFLEYFKLILVLGLSLCLMFLLPRIFLFQI